MKKRQILTDLVNSKIVIIPKKGNALDCINYVYLRVYLTMFT